MALGHNYKEVREGRRTAEKNTQKPDDTISEVEIDISFYETERLRLLLIKRLDESGWRRRLRDRVQSLVYNMPFKKLSIQDIVQELAPKASSTISEDIKEEILLEAKKSLKETSIS